jgi:hypothetical protein
MRDSYGKWGRCSIEPKRISQHGRNHGSYRRYDTVGLTLTDTSKYLVLCGVTIPEVCVGLKLSTVKYIVEAMVEVGPSMDKGGATKVGLSRSKYGKGGGDGLYLFGEGDKGVWYIAKGKLEGRYLI